MVLTVINAEKNDEIKVTFDGRSVARVSVDYYTYDDDNKFSSTSGSLIRSSIRNRLNMWRTSLIQYLHINKSI